MSFSRLFLATALSAGVFLGAATSASAATRYADPASAVASGACLSASPCTLAYAITGAASGDTIVVAPGDYTVAAAITAAQIVHIEGQAGQPRPRLLGGAGLAGPAL